jgi:hypothetical protein
MTSLDSLAAAEWEVRPAIRTSGVNFVDVYHREGKYKAPLPFIPRQEGAGHVEALGESVSGFSIGDPVGWFGLLGSYAEKAVVPAHRLLKVPTGMPLDISVALMAQGLKSYALSHPCSRRGSGFATNSNGQECRREGHRNSLHCAKGGTRSGCRQRRSHFVHQDRLLQPGDKYLRIAKGLTLSTTELAKQRLSSP